MSFFPQLNISLLIIEYMYILTVQDSCVAINIESKVSEINL